MVILMLLVFLLALQYRLWIDRGNLFDVKRFKEIKHAQIEKNQVLRERNQALAAEVLDLKQGLEAIEEKARSEMGMIKNNETSYQIVDKADMQNDIAKER